MPDISAGYTAQITDGQISSGVTKINQTTGKIETNKTSETAGGELDKDAFLQLLVAQMKYQDPLEPTDNTEYVSQLANFSSLEQMTNMNDSLSNMSQASDLQRATSLVGNYATVKVGDQSITGKVDSVEYKDGTAYLLIEGNKYPLSSLVEAVDSAYLTATTLSEQFDEILKGLPSTDSLSDADIAKIKNLRSAYDAMDIYQKSFISKDSLSKLTVYENKVKEIEEAKKAAEETTGNTEKT